MIRCEGPDVEIPGGEFPSSTSFTGHRYMTPVEGFGVFPPSMVEHWNAGKNDVLNTLNNDAWHNRAAPHDGIAIYDLTQCKALPENTHERR